MTGPDDVSDAVDVVVKSGIDDVDPVNDVVLADAVVFGDNIEVLEAGVDESEFLCDT